LALPIFSSDAISSSAYATEEILLALVLAGSISLNYSIGVAAVISLLFAIVAISYRQTVLAYPSGGGAYIVARENLGLYPGILAAAALLTDYSLQVAVSVAAGVAAIISAMPELMEFRIIIGLLLIAFIALINLRGVRESGWIFAWPTYLFIGIGLLLLATGIMRVLQGDRPHAGEAETFIAAAQPLTIFLLMRAFASGCAALTGIEAISNAVPAFRPPESKNAAATLLLMMAVCITLFFGVTLFAQLFHVVPDPTGHETVVSKLGRAVFGAGPLYYILQLATAVILVLAANTSFGGFPRLASILARDRLAPRQLANLGDRLVFSNGIILLALFSGALLVIFGGYVHSLIPLYAVGVFISFTLSQAGMVMRWRKLKTKGWKLKAGVNAVGALSTGIVLVVVAGVKFIHGAWIVLIVIPLLVLVIRKINMHYVSLGAALRVREEPIPRAVRHSVVVLIPGIHRGVVSAMLYAKSIGPECEAVFVEIDPTETARIQEMWKNLGMGVPLTVLKSPWRSLTEPIIKYVRTVRTERHMDMVTVVLPEFATTRWWHKLLHNQSGLLLKFALMFEPGVVVSNVRYHLKESEDSSAE
ncbi:MAG: amino acid permease, partial [Armatimonadetes bacterium]|nr:amino acid permease [Armatimonadota bacterium]NIM23258.1 amino acid permease [Armatimonadota bacterium]NIM67126.1 amino acid permease [Armatimonadota bacterium]NIM75653.1 amino acid permease [Armatimonadota bacterium]NIN05315.1 amino acid permease [Armatimonadota bacterium]